MKTQSLQPRIYRDYQEEHAGGAVVFQVMIWVKSLIHRLFCQHTSFFDDTLETLGITKENALGSFL